VIQTAVDFGQIVLINCKPKWRISLRHRESLSGRASRWHGHRRSCGCVRWHWSAACHGPRRFGGSR